MKKTTFFLGFGFLISSIHLVGQTCPSQKPVTPCDLVTDGSMESFNASCTSLAPNDLYNTNYKPCYWTNPAPDPVNGSTWYGSPDYFNDCATYYNTPPNVWNSVNSHLNFRNATHYSGGVWSTTYTMNAHTGSGYSGGVAYTPGSYNQREYVYSQLAQPLTPGVTYNLSMWVRLADNCQYGIDQLQMLFTNAAPLQYAIQVGSVYYPSYISNWSSSSNTVATFNNPSPIDKSQWIHLTSTVTPPTGSNYQYVTVGNISNAGTVSSVTDTYYSSNQAYYYIDDISITPPPLTVNISSTAGTCVGGTVTLSTDVVDPPSTYFLWQIVGGTSSYSPNFNVPLTNSPQVVTLHVTNNLGCSAISSYTVPAASSTLCCTVATQTISGNISTQLGSSYTGSPTTLLEVPMNTILYIDNNFTFNNAQIRMMPNSQIIVNAGKTLTLNNSHLFGCEYMWEGMQLMDGSQLLSTSGTTIDDANIAILVDATGMTTAPTISLTSNTLSKDYYGIEVQNYTGTNYPLYVTGTFFLGNSASVYSPGTSLKPYKRLWAGDIVYPVTTEIGIYANTVNKMVIGSASAGNYFENLHYGIRAIYSNIDVNGCNFLNLYPPSITDGKGIWASGNSTTIVKSGHGTEYILKVGVPGSTSKCTFNGLPYGIYTDNCITSNIQNNSFFEVTTDAIYITGCSYYRVGGIRNTSNIQNNYIRPLNTVLQNGVVYDQNTYLNATVLTNTIVIQPSGSTSEGIYVTQTTTNTPTSYTITSNNISGNFDDGIFCNQTNGVQINSNYITTNKAYAHGIYLNGGSSCDVETNTIDATSQPNNQNAILGIYLNSSKSDKIWCNNIIKAEKGINSFLDCSVADIDGNTFNGCYKSFNITWGSIGNQGSSTSGRSNIFINTLGSSGNPLWHFFNDNCSGQSYFASNCAGSSACPTLIGNASGSNETVSCSASIRTDGPTCTCPRGGRVATSINTAKAGSLSSITIYPNPANDKLFINGGNSENASITISNLLGEVILTDIIINEQGIDVSSFKNGIYICTIKLQDGSISQKQVVIVK